MAFDHSIRRFPVSRMVGKRFGFLVVNEIGKDNSGRSVAISKCDCGNTARIRCDVLNNGDAISCGCYRKVRDITHGDSCGGKTKEYNAWKRIKARTTNPELNDYSDYGGRGIKVCDKWMQSFPEFLKDVGRAPSSKHSIGRIDNDGDYEPGNVRWETSKQQARNTRRTVLNPFTATRIRELRSEGMMPKLIQEFLGVSEHSVISVLYLKQWIGVQ